MKESFPFRHMNVMSLPPPVEVITDEESERIRLKGISGSGRQSAFHQDTIPDILIVSGNAHIPNSTSDLVSTRITPSPCCRRLASSYNTYQLLDMLMLPIANLYANPLDFLATATSARTQHGITKCLVIHLFEIRNRPVHTTGWAVWLWSSHLYTPYQGVPTKV
jgi:hypothetical protein